MYILHVEVWPGNESFQTRCCIKKKERTKKKERFSMWRSKRSRTRNVICSAVFCTHFGIHRTLEMSAYSFLRINIMKEIVKMIWSLYVERTTTFKHQSFSSPVAASVTVSAKQHSRCSYRIRHDDIQVSQIQSQRLNSCAKAASKLQCKGQMKKWNILKGSELLPSDHEKSLL